MAQRMTPTSDVDGFVLAGGRSARMGRDKARVRFPADDPMAVHIASVVEQVCRRVAVIRRTDDDMTWRRRNGTPLEVVHESETMPRHPLRGLVTACEAARADRLLVVPCDVPYLTPDDLKTLLTAAAAAATRPTVDPVRATVIASTDSRIHPLVGVFPRAIRAAAARAADEERAARHFLANAQRVELTAAALRNINTPNDLKS